MTTSKPQPPKQLSNRTLRELWTRMASIYGHRWNSSYGDMSEHADGRLTTTGDTWRRGLLGITPAQIAVGLNSCIVSAEPWPPTLPEFRALCLGVPSLASVRSAVHAPNRDPFVRQLWTYLDWYALRTADARSYDRLISNAYEQAREFVMRGGTLPEPSEELPAPEPREYRPASDAVVASCTQEIEGVFERIEAQEAALARAEAEDAATASAWDDEA